MFESSSFGCVEVGVAVGFCVGVVGVWVGFCDWLGVGLGVGVAVGAGL